MKKIPVKNCLKCVNYDACEDFEDGDCPLEKKQSTVDGLHLSYGIMMTVDQWAEFFGVKPCSIRTELSKNKTLDKMFESKVARELKKLAD